MTRRWHVFSGEKEDEIQKEQEQGCGLVQLLGVEVDGRRRRKCWQDGVDGEEGLEKFATKCMRLYLKDALKLSILYSLEVLKV